MPIVDARRISNGSPHVAVRSRRFSSGRRIDLQRLENLFEEVIEEHQLARQMKSVYDWVRQVLESRLGYNADFEVILSALQDIYDYFEESVEVPEYRQTLDGDVVEVSHDIWIPTRSTLHYFFNVPKDPFVTNTLNGQWGFIQTINDLLKLYQWCVKAVVERIDPDKSPLSFISTLADIGASSTRPLDVFTLNYDTLVEETCQSQSVNWTSGFTPSWSPEVFDKVDKGVRLFKLHGSVWWETHRKTDSEPVDRVTEEREVSSSYLLIYPLLVKNLSHPIFSELLARFSKSLLSSQRLVVIGCSLSDQHLREHILFGLRNNPELEVLVVSPDGEEVRRQLLRQATLHFFIDHVKEKVSILSRGVENVSLEDILQ